MPLEGEVIAGLNEITAGVRDKSALTEQDAGLARSVFMRLVESGRSYDPGEIESWFENEGTWAARGPRTRMVNLATYVQDRHRQSSPLRMAPGGDCDC